MKRIALALALIATLALSVHLFTGSSEAASYDCIHQLRDMWCDSECSNFWQWCVEGSGTCWNDQSGNGCVSSPVEHECCSFGGGL
jgi:hypothetical protein